MCEFKTLSDLVSSVKTLRPELLTAAQAHLDDLTKPQGSLGRLEEVAARLFAIQGGAPIRIDPGMLFIAAGDHGVWAEHVSPYPQEVTHQMMLNIVSGGAASSVLSRSAGMNLVVLDAGHLGGRIDHPSVITLPNSLGQTGNIAVENAMSRELCGELILSAANKVSEAAANGAACIGTGEMGIANTTPATALYCALFDLEPFQITGPGTGLSPEGVRHKAEVIAKALALHAETVKSKDPFEILCALGGFEIAALCGVMLGAAACGLPFLVDGFIVTSAYAVAQSLCPAISGHAFFSHASAEPGYQYVLKCLNQSPLLNLGMRLGEGTGCAVAMHLLHSAADIYNDMASFHSAGVTKETNESNI